MKRLLLSAVALLAVTGPALSQSDTGALFDRFEIQEVPGISNANATTGGVNLQGSVAATVSGPSARYWSPTAGPVSLQVPFGATAPNANDLSGFSFDLQFELIAGSAVLIQDDKRKPAVWFGPTDTARLVPPSGFAIGELLSAGTFNVDGRPLETRAVGYAKQFTEQSPRRPIWYRSPDDSSQLLPMPLATPNGEALGISESGEYIAGYKVESDGKRTPVLWRWSPLLQGYEIDAAFTQKWLTDHPGRDAIAVSVDSAGVVVGTAFDPSQAWTYSPQGVAGPIVSVHNYSVQGVRSVFGVGS